MRFRRTILSNQFCQIIFAFLLVAETTSGRDASVANETGEVTNSFSADSSTDPVAMEEASPDGVINLAKGFDAGALSDAELDEGFDCYDTEDFQTGRRAFVEKTKPDFAGR